MIKIGNLWGHVRGFDERIVNGKSLGAARILLDTNIKDFIPGHITLVLGDHRCALGAREVSLCPSASCLLVKFNGGDGYGGVLVLRRR